MTQSKLSDSPDVSTPEVSSQDTSFGDILSQFEQAHNSKGETLEGNVVSVTPDGVFVDLGRKMDGVITPDGTHVYKVGDKVLVSVRGRDDEGNYMLSTIKVETPRDWSGLEAAFAEKRTIGGTVLDTKGTVVFQGDTSAHGEDHTTYTPAMNGISESTMIQDQKYVGSCPAGQQPGDITNADGRVIHTWKH